MAIIFTSSMFRRKARRQRPGSRPGDEISAVNGREDRHPAYYVAAANGPTVRPAPPVALTRADGSDRVDFKLANYY